MRVGGVIWRDIFFPSDLGGPWPLRIGVHGTFYISVQKLVNESACHFSGKIAQAKLGLKMRSQVQLGNETGRRHNG
jgi:hypothetical protein